MKVFVSVGMGGVSTTLSNNEIDENGSAYIGAAAEMTREAIAACEGAMIGGATEIYVRDAHGSAKNIDPYAMPRYVKLIRGWSGDPRHMIDGIDSSFDACMFVGYHSGSFGRGNPLSQTIIEDVFYIKLNGSYASEFTLFSYLAAYYGVPTVFLSGDKMLCDEALKLGHPALVTVPVNEVLGGATTIIHPQDVCEAIKAGAEKAIKESVKNAVAALPDKYTVEICFKDHIKAKKASFYPEVSQIDSCTLLYQPPDMTDAMRFLLYALIL